MKERPFIALLFVWYCTNGPQIFNLIQVSSSILINEITVKGKQIPSDLKINNNQMKMFKFDLKIWLN
jgi:hypothetical protein